MGMEHLGNGNVLYIYICYMGYIVEGVGVGGLGGMDKLGIYGRRC
jgi:hypothetical protein